MRNVVQKTVVTMIVGVVACAAMAAPAGAAGKKKKATRVHESFGATGIPLPLTASATTGLTPGCSAGVEGIHKTTHPFEAPGTGTLRIYIEGFTGDWDLYLFRDGSAIERSDASQAPPDLAPAEEEIHFAFRKGETVDIVACNWLGEPQIEVHYEGLFR